MVQNAALDWLTTQQDTMASLVEEWANVNSHSYNTVGLDCMAEFIKEAFSSLEPEVVQTTVGPQETLDDKGQAVSNPLGDVLQFIKRPDAPIQVLLCGHMDTVYEEDSPFQKCHNIEPNILGGPGVADMKSGIVIILKSLQALEQTSLASKIGWEVILTPDEELGSPGSYKLLQERAKKHQIGLVFEPSLPDGSLVSQRKSSSYITAIAKGKTAHAGRDFASGRNAIGALAMFLSLIQNIPMEHLTINPGYIWGGGALNIVPDHAICKINIRTQDIEHMQETLRVCDQFAKEVSAQTEVAIEVRRNVVRPPKIFDAKTEKLYEQLRECGKELGLSIDWRASGGVSDGNYLAAAGLPTIDTLGGRGGNIHTHGEFLITDSLSERAKLVVSFLVRLATAQ